MVATAHLLDFHHLRGPDAPEITPDLVDEVFASRESAPRPGDALLFRTGWMEAALGGAAVDSEFPAVAPSMGKWIADHDVAIVGADNIAVEATGRRGVLPPLHKILVRDLGVSMLELLNLREPAEDHVEGGLFIVAPLRISRGVGSPVNPLLVV